MTIKNLVIRVCDYIFYIGFGLVCITAFLTGMVNPIHGAVVGVVGLILFAMLSGAWFVFSSIADSAQLQVILAEKQNKLIERLNHNLEAHINNQFPNE